MVSQKTFVGVVIVIVALVAVLVAYQFLLVPTTPTTTPTTPTPTTPKPTTTTILPQGRVSWSIGTGDVGGVAYYAHATTADVLTKLYPQFFEISLMSVGGAAAGLSSWDAGKVDIGYTALNILIQYVTRTGRWAPDKATPQRANEMSVIVYQYPLLYGIYITNDVYATGKVKCWKDLKGLDVGIFPGHPTWAAHEVFRDAFSLILGVGRDELDNVMKLVPGLGDREIPDAVALGTVKVVWGYGDPSGPTTWLTDTLSRMEYKMHAVPACPDELELMKKNLPYVIEFTLNLSRYNIKTIDGKTAMETIGMPFGLMGSSKLSKEHIYLLFKTMIEQCNTFEKTMALFTGFCQWGLQFNVETFEKQSTWNIPIHPGVAMYLQELGYDLAKLGILAAKP
ncbi:MAG: TAXI family TRAP transporter solute-binding subunit [Zestosphaera sp.]